MSYYGDDYEYDYDDQHAIAQGEHDGERFGEEIDLLRQHLSDLGVTKEEMDPPILAIEQLFFGPDDRNLFEDGYRDEVEDVVSGCESAECDLTYEISEYILRLSDAI